MRCCTSRIFDSSNNYKLGGSNGRYPYSEAKFTLKIGKELQKKLKQEYGIDSYMTRTSRNISLTYNGKTYVNKKLDDKNIIIRGYMIEYNWYIRREKIMKKPEAESMLV